MRNWRSSSRSWPDRGTPTLPEWPGRAVVLDTDVASHSFKGRIPPWLATRLAGAQPLLSFVTAGELTQWTRLRHWGPHNLTKLSAWLSDKPVIPAARRVGIIWGEMSAGATQRGRPRPVNDTWIAACCLAYDLPLATLNLKDFTDFADHDGLKLIRS